MIRLLWERIAAVYALLSCCVCSGKLVAPCAVGEQLLHVYSVAQLIHVLRMITCSTPCTAGEHLIHVLWDSSCSMCSKAVTAPCALLRVLRNSMLQEGICSVLCSMWSGSTRDHLFHVLLRAANPCTRERSDDPCAARTCETKAAPRAPPESNCSMCSRRAAVPGSLFVLGLYLAGSAAAVRSNTTRWPL